MTTNLTHLTKDVTKGLASTKCGLENQSQFNVTVWWRDVTCPECNPYEWVPAENGLRMVRKTSTSAGDGTTTPKPRRKIVRVAD
jgi:hypothetical protein